MSYIKYKQNEWPDKKHRSTYCRQKGECKNYSACVDAIGYGYTECNDYVWLCETGIDCYQRPAGAKGRCHAITIEPLSEVKEKRSIELYEEIECDWEMDDCFDEVVE